MNIKKIIKIIKKRFAKTKLAKVRISRKLLISLGVIVLIVVGIRALAAHRGISEVEVEEARISTISEGFSYSGEVVSEEIAILNFSTPGQVAWVGVKEGDRVAKWQSLASLNTTELSLQLKKLLNFFEREFTEFDDTQDSVEDEVLTDAVQRIKKRAELDLSQTVIDVEIQNEAIRLASIIAPFEGIVTDTHSTYPGIFVSSAIPALTLANPNKVYFEVEVNEVDVVKLTPGTKVELSLNSYPDEIFEGEVTLIGFASVTTSTGGTAYEVKVSLPLNENLRFRLGMGGDGEFILTTKENVLTIPTTALVEEDEGSFVWVVEDGIAKKKEVEVGVFSLGSVEITSGLAEGEKVIIRPPARLVEGARVRVAD